MTRSLFETTDVSKGEPLLSRRSFLAKSGAATCWAASGIGAQMRDPAPSLADRLKRVAMALKMPGFVAGVVENGRLNLVQAEGYADLETNRKMQPDAVFNIASLTKTFTAVMMMQYESEKRLSLDDYLLDFPFLSVGFSSDRLVDANTRLKHVLSHTSEGVPGDNFVYSGSRYNFLYGVFEAMSGNTQHYKAVAQELQKRILDPLKMASTTGGYPTPYQAAAHAALATHYLVDAAHKTATPDTAIADYSGILFPATNIFTCLNDLAKYAVALDANVLIPPAAYDRMTAPFVLNDRTHSPYGLGWSTQVVHGMNVHWHYGWGDSYSALMVRVPAKKTTFLLLANSSGASAPFFLQYGNILSSSFAVSFLDTLVETSAEPKAFAPSTVLTSGVSTHSPLFHDAVLSEILLKQYVQSTFEQPAGPTEELLRSLVKAVPERFEQSDWCLLTALTATSSPAFRKQVHAMTEAYRNSARFHPDLSLAIANYYRDIGEQQEYLSNLQDAVTRRGYGEEASARQACVDLGLLRIRAGFEQDGRALLWRAAQDARAVESPAYQSNLVAKMRAQRDALNSRSVVTPETRPHRHV
jgi:CubicO group peptidase (beta-lactamase class C family)